MPTVAGALYRTPLEMPMEVSASRLADMATVTAAVVGLDIPVGEIGLNDPNGPAGLLV